MYNQSADKTVVIIHYGLWEAAENLYNNAHSVSN